MKKAKIVKLILWIIFIFLLLLLTITGFHAFNKFGSTPDALVEYIRSFGIFSGFVLLLFQIFQVFIAFIPGEVIEIVAGLIFKPITACLVCYVGLFFASSLIFLMVRRLGKNFSAIFVSSQKLRTLKFINTSKKLKRTIFLFFLIPGTPKDLMTYFFALTPVKFLDFITITFFARFPSIISSVIGGRFIGSGEYAKAIILFLITSFFGILGFIIYSHTKNKLTQKKQEKVLVDKKYPKISRLFCHSKKNIKRKKRLQFKYRFKTKKLKIKKLSRVKNLCLKSFYSQKA